MVADTPPIGERERPTILSIREVSEEVRVALLKELGYGVDGKSVLSSDGKRYCDPFSGVEVTIDNMVILPGNSPPVVLDDSPLSLAWYISHFGDIF